MKSKNGFVSINIICFLTLISVMALAILKIEIDKSNLINVSVLESDMKKDAIKNKDAIVLNFKNNIESDGIIDEDEIINANYSMNEIKSKIVYDKKISSFIITVDGKYNTKKTFYLKYKIDDMGKIIFTKI